MLNESILQSIDDLEDIQLESKLSIYNAMSDQLIKEYFMEQAGVFQEASEPKYNSKVKLHDDGRVPILSKIANWFRRMITVIKTYLSKHAMKRLIKRIKNSDRYNANDEFEAIMVDPDWMENEVGKQIDDANQIINRYFSTFLRLNNSGSGPRVTENLEADMNAIFGSNRRQLEADLRKMSRIKDDLHEIWDDTKSISGVNKTHKRSNTGLDGKKLTKEKLDEFLKVLEDESDHCAREIQQMGQAIDKVKDIAEIIGHNNLNQKAAADRISDQFVKFVTDATRVELYSVQILVKTAQRLWYSLGADKMEKDEDGEDV